MSNIFLVSDQHFGHENILNFIDSSGRKVRDFASVEEMNEFMVERHNSVVIPKDKVYFLGDVTMSTKASALDILRRLNGKKVLIKGNHDLCKLSAYAEHFYDVRGSHQLDKMVLTHIPIHPNSLSRWDANIHGHLHTNIVTRGFIHGEVPDNRYFCVCVEQINFTPISFEELKAEHTRRIKADLYFPIN